MKKWEEIIKDRLEGYESPLPEGSLAEFRALREGKAARPERKRIAPWIWGMAAAIAAGLAAVLFLRKPVAPEKNFQIAQPAAVIDMPAIIAQVTPLEAERHRLPKNTRQEVKGSGIEELFVQAEDNTEVPEDVVNSFPTDFSVENVQVPTAPQVADPRLKGEDFWVAPATGGLLGAGALTAMATNFAGKESPVADMLAEMRNQLAEWSGPGQSGIGIGQDSPSDSLVSYKHYMPLKAGISARVPITGQLFFTNGLDYSLYTSLFTFSLSGDKRQHVHYLSVPARLDWVFASGKYMDVYIGGGLQGDICVGATLAGNRLEKDGFSLSLLGSGGVQLNASRRVGFYLEPQLSWPFCSGSSTLVTYRSEHPVMLSVSTGIRINLGK